MLASDERLRERLPPASAPGGAQSGVVASGGDGVPPACASPVADFGGDTFHFADLPPFAGLRVRFDEVDPTGLLRELGRLVSYASYYLHQTRLAPPSVPVTLPAPGEPLMALGPYVVCLRVEPVAPLPCPFCGAPAATRRDLERWWAGCGASCPVAPFHVESTIEAAVAVWNRRPTPPVHA